MSDVLHHSRPTSIESAAANHRNSFRAKIEARAIELKTVALEEIFIPTVPINCENEQERIFKRIKALNQEIEALSERYAKLKGRWYPRIEQIQSVVCARFKITMADLSSVRRSAAAVLPRHIAMYLCRELTLRSLPEIGRRFGGRDHTTILHATRKIHSLRSTDEELDAELTAIAALVSGPVSLRPACSEPLKGTPCNFHLTTAE